MSELPTETASNPSTVDAAPASATAGHFGSGEALSHLAKMSGTGSAFGQADYVAISPLAIASLIFGLLSAVALAFTAFVGLALAGLVLGIFALIKIRGSNGTQSGTKLALAGILLSLGIGGWVVAQTVKAQLRDREAIEKCAQLIRRFGEEIKAEHYDEAYDKLMTESFRSKFPRERFGKQFHDLQAYPDYGRLEWYRLNDQPVVFEPVADSDARVAQTYAITKFTKLREHREYFILNNVEGEWKIDGLPQLFRLAPPKKKQSGGGGNAER
jgi:hypothetical protein